MKTFHYKDGRKAGSTMTVSELREALEKYPDDMPVFAEWEGVLGYVREEFFNIETTYKGDEAEACQCLVIWVEKY